VARIPGSHPGGPGSIPGMGSNLLHSFLVVANVFALNKELLFFILILRVNCESMVTYFDVFIMFRGCKYLSL